MISFLAQYKDAFASLGNIGMLLQSIATMAAVIVGGSWALHRLSKERPFQANVKIRLDASVSEFDDARRLLRVTIILENAGTSAIMLGDSPITPHHSRFAIRGIELHPLTHAGALDKMGHLVPFSWDTSPYVVALHDEPFTKTFALWFPNGINYTLEAKEIADLCMDFLVDKEFEIVNVLVQVYEGIIREAKLKRPYYWLMEKTFDLTRLGT